MVGGGPPIDRVDDKFDELLPLPFREPYDAAVGILVVPYENELVHDCHLDAVRSFASPRVDPSQ
jgi:hypothetical protein